MAAISRQLKLRFDQSVQQIGVTRAKWTLIAAVSRSPGATQRLIATKLEVTEATAGRLIDRLCSDGLLERREHSNDRRGYSIHLTEAALPLLNQLSGISRVLEAEIFSGLDHDELDQLEELLSRIAKNLAVSRYLADPPESEKAVGWDEELTQ